MIQGKPLGCGRVNYQAPSMKLKVRFLHEETITFLVLEGPTVDIILGCPWSLSTLQKSDGTPVSKQAATRLPPQRLCIDYRNLNSQMVKLPYPPPLVPATLEQLRGACIFSKLELPRTSVTPISPNLLHREAQKGKPMSSCPNAKPF
ncbi:hypothetical protein QQF64_028964 [Cirrhinus molitorella]|uniref:Uncharacterized protein n=1 Tax=Cirrhinus molitorella TaxID=172907 RepID=A0ABR3N8L3_9TELE